MEHYRNTSLELIQEVIEGTLYIEEWQVIKDYEGLYEISSFGRVKAVKGTPKIKVSYLSKKNGKPRYPRIQLSNHNKGKSFYVHQLVCNAFVEKVDGKDNINHKKGVKTHNHYSQLEWCTVQENNEHGFMTGLLKRGKKPYVNKYIKKGRSNPDVFKPIIDLQTGIFYTSVELAFILNSKQKYVNRMINGDRKPNTTQYRYA